ncbi:hypothetical protein SAMN06295905_1086 [Devosia lucknowensis]|uniref:Uncharacterized protein n=1 Tax=Devosia lucknowensis TaxID=1096929 RepID=A0A1Y6EUI7_9HYPH|nr:hypothetical protein [Devosia lucknowensis]SMQ64891.1 hypothetical protein SAMN06295905_1086 [Devosia lucknowensis]
MGRVSAVFAFAVVLIGTVPAQAQEDLRIDQSKIHVTDPAACTLIETKGIEAFMGGDFLALNFAKGIQSMEFQCNFFDVKGREGSSHLFVSAVCELPGEIYPDTLSISPYSETEIMVVSSFDAAMVAAGLYEPSGDVAMPGGSLYTRCDNLSEITVD